MSIRLAVAVCGVVALGLGCAPKAQPVGTKPAEVAILRPVPRQPRAISATAPSVTAEVDITAQGQPISPWIYGGVTSVEAAKAAGLTILRHGGNPTSTVNWQEGYWNSGNDWYSVNNPAKYKPGPPEERYKTYGELKKQGLEWYQTFPMMGRVSKDSASVGFDIRKYPGQTEWEEQKHSGDQHPYAGNGKVFVLDKDGNKVLDKGGKPLEREIPGNPDDVSIPQTPDQQCGLLEFEVWKMGYGRADQGGDQVRLPGQRADDLARHASDLPPRGLFV